MLLVQPPIEDYYDTSVRTYPLALLYLAAAVREAADVDLLDLRTNRRPQPIPNDLLPDLKRYYRDDVYTPLSFFKRYYRFGANRGEIKSAIETKRPDLVAISSLFTTYSLEALDVAQCCKEVSPDIVTVIGGIHPTLFPEHALSTPYVDYVIRGEGETPFNRLVRALTSGKGTGFDHIRDIGGVCFREKGDFHITEPHIEDDIDRIPYRGLVDPANYRINRRNYTFLLTSRGCPFNCAFCGKPAVPYRKRSLAALESEISECLGLGIQAIDFEDDMLTLDLPSFRRVLALFRGTGLTLSAMNGIYSEGLDKATLEDMYSAGFRRLNFSLVDASRSVTDTQNRYFGTNFLNLLPYLESSPFLTETHFIIGLPEQTADDVMNTIIFLMGKRVLLGPSIFYAAPNSATFDGMIGNDWEKNITAMRSSALFQANPLLPRSSLYTFMKIVRFVNLVKRLLDNKGECRRLSDLPALLVLTKNTRDAEIFRALIQQRKLLWYDLRLNRLTEEPHERRLVQRFFEQSRGKIIKGFKTGNTLVID